MISRAMGCEIRTMTKINAQAETWRDVTRSLRAHADTTPRNINTRHTRAGGNRPRARCGRTQVPR